MKLTFSFTDTPDIQSLSASDIYNSHFELPDEALHLDGIEERVLTIADIIGDFTLANLFLSCKELGLKFHPIRTNNTNTSTLGPLFDPSIIPICFRRHRPRLQYRQLKILSPNRPILGKINSYVGRKKARKSGKLYSSLIRINAHWWSDEGQRPYADKLKVLSEQLLTLLNAEPTQRGRPWECAGFQYSWPDNTLLKRQKKRWKEKTKPQTKHKQGVGRSIGGAIPGVFQGVQMRSQLEIRFAAELESRDVQWQYEIERLGKGNYLVDFYLPDLGKWVEVKGKFEPRDHFLLKEVAQLLKSERNETLYVYSQSKCYFVTADDFEEIARNEIWNRLLS